VLFLTKIIAYQLRIHSPFLRCTGKYCKCIGRFHWLYSLYVAAKPRDFDHPYGHGKAEFVSAAIEGGLIVAAVS